TQRHYVNLRYPSTGAGCTYAGFDQWSCTVGDSDEVHRPARTIMVPIPAIGYTNTKPLGVYPESMMEVIKFGKLAALVLAFGAGATTGADSGLSSEEAALRAITTFYFEFDSSDLKPEAMRALDVHAKDLKAQGNRVVLEGHTDERGTREYNMALGERRAAAVQ